MEDKGLEPVVKSSQKTDVSPIGGAESGAVGAQSASFDADLRHIIEHWPSLPDDVKAGIVAMVRAACE